ncbi:MAG: T9SS type A sorting domain-containing protein, partial [Ignavibacteria bacterium]
VGIRQLSSGVPSHFRLSQNYPNPFNPSTKISYELRVTNYVLLKVYDVLGNEVKTLVNEKQNAGTYEVSFDASNFSSGSYFYKLVTNGFIETKKMFLIK